MRDGYITSNNFSQQKTQMSKQMFKTSSKLPIKTDGMPYRIVAWFSAHRLLGFLVGPTTKRYVLPHTNTQKAEF